MTMQDGLKTQEAPEASPADSAASEAVGFCPGCGMRCPLDDLQCGKGMRIAREAGEGHGGDEPACEGSERAGRGGSHGPRGAHRGEGRGAHGHHGAGGRASMNPDTQLTHLFHHCAHLAVHRQGAGQGRSGVLVALLKRGPLSQRDLAEGAGVRAATTSEQVAKLEEQGLVRRAQSEQDKRSFTVELTEAGEAEARRFLKERAERDNELFSVLSDEEKQQLTATLGKLADYWHATFAARPGEGGSRGRGHGHSGHGGRGHGGHDDHAGHHGLGPHADGASVEGRGACGEHRHARGGHHGHDGHRGHGGPRR